jgi:hypothetical protein
MSTIRGDVLAFIDRYVRSIEQLEILLLLHARRDRGWTAQAVSDELRGNPESAAGRLQELATDGLLVESGNPHAYSYAATGELDRAIAGLAEAYRDFRLRVIERVFKKPDGISEFAEAFRFRRKDS